MVQVLVKNSRKAKGLDPLQGQPPSTESYETANPFRKTQMRAEARAAEDLKDAVPADDCLFTKLQTAELKEDGGRRLTDKEIAYQGTIFVTAGLYPNPSLPSSAIPLERFNRLV